MIYELSDSLLAFSRHRYIPYYRYELQDERGTVLQQYVGAQQEFLSRVAGALRPDQKLLIQSVLLKSKQLDSTTLLTTWTYPNYEGEVSDLGENGNAIRTRYWSIDSVGSEKPVELFATRALSVPADSLAPIKRSPEELKKLRSEAEEYVYYEFKSFVLSRFRVR